MVGPVSEAERAAFTRKLKAGVAALVGLSAGLTALRVDATLPLAGAAVLVGVTVGWGLGWFVVPSGPSPAERQRQRRERVRESPFADGGETDDGGAGGGETDGGGTDGGGTDGGGTDGGDERVSA